MGDEASTIIGNGRLDQTFVSAGGLRTSVWHAGDGGRTALFLHGGTPGADGRGYWEPCLHLMAPRFRCIAPDLPGFGHTDKPPPGRFAYSQDMRVAHMIALIEALGLSPGLSRVTLIGTSLGGALALGVCLARPDLVDGLVLVASAGLANPQASRTAALVGEHDFSVDALRRLLRSFVDDGFDLPESLVAYSHRLSLIPGHREALSATARWAREHGMLAIADARLASIKTPALVINGKGDRVTPLPLAYRFLELIENASGSILSRCGHLPMIERPRELADMLSRFIDPP